MALVATLTIWWLRFYIARIHVLGVHMQWNMSICMVCVSFVLEAQCERVVDCRFGGLITTIQVNCQRQETQNMVSLKGVISISGSKGFVAFLYRATLFQAPQVDRYPYVIVTLWTRAYGFLSLDTTSASCNDHSIN